MKILLVDDEPDILEFLGELLEMFNAEVLTANCGEIAVDKLLADKFDVLVTDVKMKNGDGMFVLEQIQENKIDLKKIIVMTGYSQYPEEAFYEAGAHVVFQKPIDIEKLKESIFN